MSEQIATQEPARFTRRLMAMLYDSFLLFAVLAVSGGVLSGLLGSIPQDGNLAYFAFLLSVSFAFFGLFWTRGGQTLGMMTWRIRVETIKGESLDFRTALLRFLVSILSWAPCGLGYVWMLWDRENRTWHDMATGTRIVHIPKTQK